MDHDPRIHHNREARYITACERCRREYEVARATDPLRAPGTDDEPHRDRSRLLALAIVGALLLIAAALWGNR